MSFSGHSNQNPNYCIPPNINIQTMNINLNPIGYSNAMPNNASPQRANQPYHIWQSYKKANQSFHVFALQTQDRPSVKLNESLKFAKLNKSLKSIYRNKEAKGGSHSIFDKNMKSTRCCISQLMTADLHNPENHQNISNQDASRKISQSQLERQNARLRDQNNLLKHELIQIRKGSLVCSTFRSKNISENYCNRDFTDREAEVNLKSDGKYNKQLEIRLDLITKQCRVYEDIIQKMQTKIKKLLEQNKRIANDIQEYSMINQTISQLQNQVDAIFGQYQKLQELIQRQQQEWIALQREWHGEKQQYINKIQLMSNALNQTLWNKADSISRAQTPRDTLRQQIDQLMRQYDQEQNQEFLPGYQEHQYF